MHHPITVVLAFALTVVSANHINCTNPACPELCNFHGQWNHDTNECVCDDMYYTLVPTSSNHSHLHRGHDAEQCDQRRKSQLTAYELNMWGMFGAPFWYLGRQDIAIAMIVLFWGSAIVIALGKATESTLIIGIGTTAEACFSVWWLVNMFLFIANYYNDANGQSLYAW